jgi:hypothetical protein
MRAALRREPAPWPDNASPKLESELMTQAGLHGVAPLLHESTAAAAWPLAVRAGLRERALELARWELRHEQVLHDVLRALGQRHIRPLLLKGTPLAHSVYRSPALRPRADTDLLVPQDARHDAQRCLRDLGFTPQLAMTGDLVSYQASFTLPARDESLHTIDLHWRIKNSQVLSRLLGYTELMAQAQPLPQLGSNAWHPCAAHALLIACMHKASHRHSPYTVDGATCPDENRLIWLYDIHLLAQRLGDHEWQQLARLANERGLTQVCAEGLATASQVFGGVPLLQLIPPKNELPWRYFNAGKRGQAWLDLLALDGTRERIQWLRESLLPGREYMQARYDRANGPAWWLYLRRACSGIVKRAFPHA